MITHPEEKIDCENPQSPTFLHSSCPHAKNNNKCVDFSFQPIQTSTSIPNQNIKIEELQQLKPEASTDGFNSPTFLEKLDQMNFIPNDSKVQINGKEEDSPGGLPLITREKLSLQDDALEMPDLTAESVMSSSEHDVDSESNSNELLISSASRHKKRRLFHEQSDQSEEMPEQDENYRIYHRNQTFAESKEGDRSQSDDIITICQHCTSLFDKCRRLQAENKEIQKQNRCLVDEIAKYEQSSQKELIEQGPISQSFRQEQVLPSLIKDLFLFQIQQSYKTLLNINQLLSSSSIDFLDNECIFLQRFCNEIKKIEINVLGRQVRQDRKQAFQQIHCSYKKIIDNLIKNFQAKLSKKDADFKKFMKSFADKQMLDHKHYSPTLLIPNKLQRHHKKSKTFAEKEEATDEGFLKLLLEQGRQKLQWLQLNLQRQKERSKNLQKSHKQQTQKYIMQINELVKEKSSYKNQAAKYSQQFAEFIQKLSRAQSNILTESQFFKNVSHRVFQISNSIPFEDNDEQNLFVPENQEQLFDMIERIRKFYLKFESYNLQRDNYYESEKSLLIHFIKEVIEESKISEYYILELLAKKQYKDLSYLKQIIFTSKLRKNSLQPTRDPKNQRLLLHREGVGSFTFQNDRT